MGRVPGGEPSCPDPGGKAGVGAGLVRGECRPGPSEMRARPRPLKIETPPPGEQMGARLTSTSRTCSTWGDKFFQMTGPTLHTGKLRPVEV